jgi:hypothetical protein
MSVTSSQKFPKKISVQISEEMLSDILEYQTEKNYKYTSVAIRDLLQFGLNYLNSIPPKERMVENPFKPRNPNQNQRENPFIQHPINQQQSNLIPSIPPRNPFLQVRIHVKVECK